MHEEIIIAGFGGQGILFMGHTLALAAMYENRQVSWYPSYGPEQRGGTCNCSVVISSKRIGSPVVDHPHSLVVLNEPSLRRFEPQIKENGWAVLNSSLVSRPPERTDIRYRAIPANELAESLVGGKVANMVVLGAFLKVRPLVTLDAVEHALQSILCGKQPELTERNLQALRLGWAYNK